MGKKHIELSAMCEHACFSLKLMVAMVVQLDLFGSEIKSKTEIIVDDQSVTVTITLSMTFKSDKSFQNK